MKLKKHLLLGRNAMTNLDSIFKSREITLPTNIFLVKALIFPVVMYGSESWTIKKAEHQKIDASELWCWEKTLESPLDCKEIHPVNPKGKQSWTFSGRTDVEAETPKLWHPDGKNWLFGKDLDAGKDWRQKEELTENVMVDGVTDSMDLSLRKLQELGMVREAWRSSVLGVANSQTWLSDWTELMIVPRPSPPLWEWAVIKLLRVLMYKVLYGRMFSIS